MFFGCVYLNVSYWLPKNKSYISPHIHFSSDMQNRIYFISLKIFLLLKHVDEKKIPPPNHMFKRYDI